MPGRLSDQPSGGGPKAAAENCQATGNPRTRPASTASAWMTYHCNKVIEKWDAAERHEDAADGAADSPRGRSPPEPRSPGRASSARRAAKEVALCS